MTTGFLYKEELAKKLLLVDLPSNNDSKASEVVFLQAENVGNIGNSFLGLLQIPHNFSLFPPPDILE